MEIIMNELKKYGIEEAQISCLSDKDGILVYQLASGGQHYVLKYFVKEDYQREIYYYQLLNKLAIKTINIYGHTDKSILMENINFNEDYRLANKEDLEVKEIIVSLADYYHELHDKGKVFLRGDEAVNLYSEFKSIDEESILFLKEASGYENEAFWKALPIFLAKWLPYYESHKTLTYNDFFYGNLIISKNLREAFVFDYNLMGEGLAYFDISNVMSGLNEEMRAVFIKHYGYIANTETHINHVVSHMFALIRAYKRDSFPAWAIESKELLLSGEMAQFLEKCCTLIG